jgi:acetyl esterase/lipase
MPDFAASFWKYIQAELSSKNIDVGVAILQYSEGLHSVSIYSIQVLNLIPALVPSASFPTPLKQTVAAIEHLVSTGVQPPNLYITGDSAGANLVLQVISHILHPLEGVRPLRLPSRIGGIFLMSPWVKLSGTDGSMAFNDDSDIIGPLCVNYWGKQVLLGIPDSQLPYIEASRAPDSWFKAMDTVVERVLITAGSAECLCDSIEVFAQKICDYHSGATFLMQEHGVHDDPYLDFLTKETKKGTLMIPILEWFTTGFSKVYHSGEYFICEPG